MAVRDAVPMPEDVQWVIDIDPVNLA